MLYDYDKTLKITLRIFEYFQVKEEKQPHSLKFHKPLHRAAVVSFLEQLPPTAGADFIWNFLLLQFYTYHFQEQERRPTPQWFLGKEAWKRWNEYAEGVLFYAHEWARTRGYKNPVLLNSFKPVSKDIFERERLKMSRISGPNFCVAKYGDSPYEPDNGICRGCSFEKDCIVLFSMSEGSSLFQKLKSIEVSKAEEKQLRPQKVSLRNHIKKSYEDSEQI